MSVAAVLNFFQQQLQGASLGGQTVQAFISPLPFLRNGTPEPLRLYITPGRVRVNHPTMSGFPGYRRQVYAPLNLYLRQTIQSSESVDTWAELVDFLCHTIRLFRPNTLLDDLGHGDSPQWIGLGTGTPGDLLEFELEPQLPKQILQERPITMLWRIGVYCMEQCNG